MTLDEAIAELRRRNEAGPDGPGLPTEEDVDVIEALLRTRFHPDYRRFLLEASDVVTGALEPATITDPGSHTFLVAVVNDAEMMGVPPGLFPFCEDNSDFYCLTPEGQVKYWSHDGATDESWPSLADWIEQVWLA